MLGGEEDSDVEIPSVDRRNPRALLDVGRGLPFLAMIDSETRESWRPAPAVRKASASAADRVRPCKDRVPREFLEAAKERDRVNDGNIRSRDCDNESWIQRASRLRHPARRPAETRKLRSRGGRAEPSPTDCDGRRDDQSESAKHHDRRAPLGRRIKVSSRTLAQPKELALGLLAAQEAQGGFVP